MRTTKRWNGTPSQYKKDWNSKCKLVRKQAPVVFFLLIGHESGAMCEWLVVLLHKNTTLLVLCYFKVHQVTLKHTWAQIPPLPPGRREVRFAMKLIPAHCCIFFPSDNLFSFSKTLELAFFPGAHWAVPEKGFHSSLLFHGRAVQMLWVPSPGSGHF